MVRYRKTISVPRNR